MSQPTPPQSARRESVTTSASTTQRGAPLTILLSHRLPLVTVARADVGGPGARHRRVASLPSELPFLPAGLCLEAALGASWVLVSAGASSPGTTVGISSIVVYPARAGRDAHAYIYVEERHGEPYIVERARPFHLVQCPRLPADVRFVEVPEARGVEAVRRKGPSPASRRLRPR